MSPSPAHLTAHAFTSPFSEDDRVRAVERSEREGVTVVASELGISPATIRQWRRRLGRSMTPRELGQRAFAIRARSMRVTELRTQLQHDFLALSWAITGRLLERLDDYRPGDVRNLVIAAATALDKFRLEAGEATGRHESVSIDAARERLADFLGTTPDAVEEVVAERIRMRRTHRSPVLDIKSADRPRRGQLVAGEGAAAGRGVNVPEVSKPPERGQEAG